MSTLSSRQQPSFSPSHRAWVWEADYWEECSQLPALPLSNLEGAWFLQRKKCVPPSHLRVAEETKNPTRAVFKYVINGHWIAVDEFVPLHCLSHPPILGNWHRMRLILCFSVLSSQALLSSQVTWSEALGTCCHILDAEDNFRLNGYFLSILK